MGRRDWRRLRALALWTAGLIAVQLVLEPQATMDYVRALGLGWVGENTNYSPYGISPVLWAVLLGAGRAPCPAPCADALGLGGRCQPCDARPAPPADLHVHGAPGGSSPGALRRRQRAAARGARHQGARAMTGFDDRRSGRSGAAPGCRARLAPALILLLLAVTSLAILRRRGVHPRLRLPGLRAGGRSPPGRPAPLRPRRRRRGGLRHLPLPATVRPLRRSLRPPPGSARDLGVDRRADGVLPRGDGAAAGRPLGALDRGCPRGAEPPVPLRAQAGPGEPDPLPLLRHRLALARPGRPPGPFHCGRHAGQAPARPALRLDARDPALGGARRRRCGAARGRCGHDAPDGRAGLVRLPVPPGPGEPAGDHAPQHDPGRGGLPGRAVGRRRHGRPVPGDGPDRRGHPLRLAAP